jgi:hypothetical protein
MSGDLFVAGLLLATGLIDLGLILLAGGMVMIGLELVDRLTGRRVRGGAIRLKSGRHSCRGARHV